MVGSKTTRERSDSEKIRSIHFNNVVDALKYEYQVTTFSAVFKRGKTKRDEPIFIRDMG